TVPMIGASLYAATRTVTDGEAALTSAGSSMDASHHDPSALPNDQAADDRKRLGGGLSDLRAAQARQRSYRLAVEVGPAAEILRSVARDHPDLGVDLPRRQRD